MFELKEVDLDEIDALLTEYRAGCKKLDLAASYTREDELRMHFAQLDAVRQVIEWLHREEPKTSTILKETRETIQAICTDLQSYLDTYKK